MKNETQIKRRIAEINGAYDKIRMDALDHIFYKQFIDSKTEIGYRERLRALSLERETLEWVLKD